MKSKGFILVQTLLATALLHTPLHAQSKRLVFNLTDPNEAARWTTEFHDSSQGAAGFQEGLFRLASGPDAPAFMERQVDFDSGEYNRMTVDMRVVNPDNPGGLVGSAAFLFDDNGMVIPESRILTNTPVGVRTSVVIRLDQSVFWTGHVNRIRFDPVWGVGRAYIASITLYLEPPPAPAPQYYFTNRETTAGWMIGEFDEQSSLFVARPTNIDSNGMAFTNTGPSPVLQNLQTNLNADLITSAELVLRNAQPISTTARFFWSTAEDPDVSNERSITLPVAPSMAWQTLRFDLGSHPGWAGQIGTIIINPTLAAGSTQVRSLRFEGIEGLGERGEEDALVTWRTHSEVGRELTSGNYKPLLVLITMDGNPFSTEIELDLAGNQRFLQNAREFHAVRMQYDDPATARVFTDIYRIPVLATMTWDFDRREWEVRERLIGPEVASDSVSIMERTLAR
ncbi:MAG: hypothetical protein JJU11_18285 [Candidatus Sumerlaeia bacterium]|nr:hypothetical protein [Candidatus Sumerlaeia bacterium]